MHELGIVMHMIEQVERVAEENGVDQVAKINMEIGEVSSVIPDLFTDCFHWAKKKTKHLREAELELIILEGVSYCQDCRGTYKTTEFAKKCPYCGSDNTYLITGSEINIRDIEVADPAPSQPERKEENHV